MQASCFCPSRVLPKLCRCLPEQGELILDRSKTGGMYLAGRALRLFVRRPAHCRKGAASLPLSGGARADIGVKPTVPAQSTTAACTQSVNKAGLCARTISSMSLMAAKRNSGTVDSLHDTTHHIVIDISGGRRMGVVD